MEKGASENADIPSEIDDDEAEQKDDKLDLGEEDVHPALGVSHGATVQSSIGRISTGTRKCRIEAEELRPVRAREEVFLSSYLRVIRRRTFRDGGGARGVRTRRVTRGAAFQQPDATPYLARRVLQRYFAHVQSVVHA